MLGFMNAQRKAIRLSGLAVLVLFGGCFLAILSPRFQAGIVAASFVAYVACTRRAMVLCHADDLVFAPKASENREEAAREALRSGLLAGSAGALSLGRGVNAIPRAARSTPPPHGRRPFPRPIEGAR
jgi:hypothetical protein